MSPQINYKCDQVVLTPKWFTASNRVTREVHEAREGHRWASRELEYRLTTYLYGKQISGVEITTPSSWLQMLKEDLYRRFPRLLQWVKVRWPVQTTTQTLQAWQAFPDLQKPAYGNSIVLNVLHC